MIITDEILEVAQKAANVATSDCLRAALEAVAPMLQKALTDADICRTKAQGMREAAQLVDHEYDAKRLLARAQELDPK